MLYILGMSATSRLHLRLEAGGAEDSVGYMLRCGWQDDDSWRVWQSKIVGLGELREVG